MIRRAGRRLWVIVAVVLVVTVIGAAPAAAAGIPVPGPGSILNCNNDKAPIPASPYGSGPWIVNLSNPGLSAFSAGGHMINGQAGKAGQVGDPFTGKGVSLESTYGSTPQWWTYDNGCAGQFIAGAGTTVANIELEISGALPNWSQALLDSVVGDHSWLSTLDQPVVAATHAVRNGVWGPWVGVVLVLVAALVLIRSRAGRLGGAATAAAWAVIVLVATTWLMNYPKQSVDMVDQGISSATGLIATGFDPSAAAGASPSRMSSAQAQRAVDGQMDQIVRMTQYRTWAVGVFGDPDSATAHKYGPAVFRATHFTWNEYATYESDPAGRGASIVKAKADAFTKLAGQIKKEDPRAYSYFTGSNWGQRITLGLVNIVTSVIVLAFILAAGLAILLAFVLMRVLVPFAPVAGVIFMIDTTRETALGVLKKVGGPLIMGPVYFVVALILLRIDSALLTSNLWWIIKIGLIAVSSYIAWRLTRPSAYGIKIPGLSRLTRLVTLFAASRAGAASGVRAAMGDEHRDPPARSSNWAAFMPERPALEASSAPTAAAAGGDRSAYAGQSETRHWVKQVFPERAGNNRTTDRTTDRVDVEGGSPRTASAAVNGAYARPAIEAPHVNTGTGTDAGSSTNGNVSGDGPHRPFDPSGPAAIEGARADTTGADTDTDTGTDTGAGTSTAPAVWIQAGEIVSTRSAGPSHPSGPVDPNRSAGGAGGDVDGSSDPVEGQVVASTVGPIAPANVEYDADGGEVYKIYRPSGDIEVPVVNIDGQRRGAASVDPRDSGQDSGRDGPSRSAGRIDSEDTSEGGA